MTIFDNHHYVTLFFYTFLFSCFRVCNMHWYMHILITMVFICSFMTLLFVSFIDFIGNYFLRIYMDQYSNKRNSVIECVHSVNDHVYDVPEWHSAVLLLRYIVSFLHKIEPSSPVDKNGRIIRTEIKKANVFITP